MTTPIAYRRDQATRAASRKLQTFALSLRAGILADLTARTAIRFPSDRYRQDPVAFAREILGVQLTPKQVEILEGIRDNKRVAVRSGHKTGKSFTAAVIALWFFCSYSEARVIMTSTTSRQVDAILWRQLRMVLSKSGRCSDCAAADPSGFRIPKPCPHSAVIPEEPGGLARTGLRSQDFREIVGFTAKDAEAMAGISGGNILYIVDEASGVPQAIFDAIEGNRAGGARIILYSNPTKNEGEFYDAFFDPKKAKGFCKITVSSEETPNYISGEDTVPGMATREWVEERREEWGEDSALFKIRVKGEHALHEEGRIFSVQAITDAEARWSDPELTLDVGRLFIGVDPAGSTGTGDESVFSLRRGQKVLSMHHMRSLDADGHLAQILDMVRKNRREGDPIPVVVVDRGGEIGSRLFGRLQLYTETAPGQFEVCGIQASAWACRMPEVYDRMRDLLTANFEDFIRNGGAIPTDPKLVAEMHMMEWKAQVNGKLKVTPKDEIKKTLGRSPDRYDAVVLSCWTPRDFMDAEIQEQKPADPPLAPSMAEGREYWEAVAAHTTPAFVY